VAYLTKPEIRALGRPAVVVKGCDARSLMTLILENQVAQEEVVVIGVGCEGLGERKCQGCQVRTPPIYDHLVGEEVPPDTGTPDGSPIHRLESMSLSERWDFWQKELERCTKCYACRAVCPLCYCDSCFVDQTRPAWTSSGSTPRDNFVYHLFRAFHLAGRCSGCGECQRACPQGIPLGLLNRKVARDVARIYGETDRSPLLQFQKDDPEDFIR
jgi:ferredoxin